MPFLHREAPICMDSHAKLDVSRFKRKPKIRGTRWREGAAVSLPCFTRKKKSLPGKMAIRRVKITLAAKPSESPFPAQVVARAPYLHRDYEYTHRRQDACFEDRAQSENLHRNEPDSTPQILDDVSPQTRHSLSSTSRDLRGSSLESSKTFDTAPRKSRSLPADKKMYSCTAATVHRTLKEIKKREVNYFFFFFSFLRKYANPPSPYWSMREPRVILLILIPSFLEISR